MRHTPIKAIRPNLLDKLIYLMAGGLGFEPRLAESESAVLPLDDPPSIPYVVQGDGLYSIGRILQLVPGAFTPRVLRAFALLAAAPLP
jgi:hypothetical protein